MLTTAIESKNIECFPVNYFNEEIEFREEVIDLKDGSRYYGQTLVGTNVPHGFGVELTKNWKTIRVGYFKEGLKSGYFNTFGLDGVGNVYKNKGFFTFGQQNGYSKIEFGGKKDIIMGNFENGKINGICY